MKSGKRRLLLGGLVFILMVVVLLTNPTEQDYIKHADYKEEHSRSLDNNLIFEIERINFFFFSTYAPKEKKTEHYGVVHLGFLGQFFQISEGQFDYPWWLDFFN